MEAFDCKNELFLLASGNSALPRVAKLLIREDKNESRDLASVVVSSGYRPDGAVYPVSQSL